MRHLLAGLMILAFFGCGGSDENESGQHANVRLLAEEFPNADGAAVHQRLGKLNYPDHVLLAIVAPPSRDRARAVRVRYSARWPRGLVMQRIVLGTVVCVLTACSGEEAAPTTIGSGGNGTTASSGASGPDTSQSAGAGGRGSGGWDVLIDADWEVEGGNETYLCARKTTDNDTYVSGFRSLSPLGTHHTIAAKLLQPTAEDGVYECDGSDVGHTMMFASGVGTNDLVFPKGIAVFIPGGTQLVLNLHLVNTSPDPITGTSGTLVQTIDASAVTDVAEVVLAGTSKLFIAPHAKAMVQGKCTFEDDATIVSVWPHMHQYGTHMKVTHLGTILHDGPYSFNEQVAYDTGLVLVKMGESVTVKCSYQNTSSSTIAFGDSSDAEMCFAGLYHYPAIGQQMLCTE